jgi:hypothetical protein
MSYEGWLRVDASARTAPGQLHDEALISIILAATAAEGLLNDLVGYIQYMGRTMPNKAQGDLPRLIAVADALDSMEQQNSQTLSKYLVASLLLDGSMRRGAEPFQSLDDLFVLRNSTIHVKPVTPADQGRVVKVVSSLAQRGHALEAAEVQMIAGQPATWWFQLQNAQTARWAADAARAAMLSLAESIVAVADGNGIFQTYFVSYLRSLPHSLQPIPSASGGA